MAKNIMFFLLKRFIYTVFIVSALSASCYAQSPLCKGKPFTVTSKVSGTIINHVSAREIARSAVTRLARKWKETAIGKYGPEYQHVLKGPCTCKFNIWPTELKKGDRFIVTCKGTAPACRVKYWSEKPEKCKFVRTNN